MQKYLGVKEIRAKAMTRSEYHDYQRWELPAYEDGSDEGFLVEYLDGGASNHPDHQGYISWSPKDVFERAYRPTNGMSFGLAVEAAKKGLKIARAGWNGKGMFVVLFTGEDTPLDCQPYFAMYTADEKWAPGWLASQADMLADDWAVVA